MVLAVASTVTDAQTVVDRTDLTPVERACAITAMLFLLACIGLAARLPRWATAAGIAAMALAIVPWYLPPGFFCLAIIAFIAAQRADVVLAVVVVLASVIWGGVAAYLRPEVSQDLLWLMTLIVILPAACGWALGVNRRRRDAAEQRADALELETTRVRERERQILARELHDVVAHGLTLISMQAAVMRITTKPDQLETARAAIERSSRDSLEELKRLLQVLRASDVITDDASVVRDASADDERGLAEVVARLAQDLRGVGHTVDVVCEVGAVPQSVELAADRVLREAVTNIVKHGERRPRARSRCARSPVRSTSRWPTRCVRSAWPTSGPPAWASSASPNGSSCSVVRWTPAWTVGAGA